MKNFLLKYKHGLPLMLYMIIYLAWFAYLEKTVTNSYTLIHLKADDYIPFLEIFVIPYFLWFFYVSVVVLYGLFKDKTGYYKNCIFLFTGMTIFLLISTLWPNGQNLRPYILPNENFLTQMVRGLYRTDTPTNIWPSIHVYNSLGTHFAVLRSAQLHKNKWLCNGSLVLCISIILSTMFIKQHSIFDVITAFIMAAVMYLVVYQGDRILGGRLVRKPDSVQEN